MHLRQLLPLLDVLFASYTIWGSTYFVIRIGMESWPPLTMAGMRFLAAGILLLAFLLLCEHKLPLLRPPLNAALVGLLLLAIGNGMVTVAEHQNVPSDTAAMVVVTTPLFTLCFSRLFGIKTRKLEWMGTVIGLTGTIMLSSDGNLSGNPWGAILILIGPISWMFSSVYGSYITLPVGVIADAIEALTTGAVLMIAPMIAGEKLTTLPSPLGFLAVGYSALFGLTIAINAYMYLILNTSPALVTSYACVNPVVAVSLGTGPGGETLSRIEWLTLGAVVFVVALVTLGKYLFPAKPVVAPVIWSVSNGQMNPLHVGLHAGTFAADPFFQTFARRSTRQFLTPT